MTPKPHPSSTETRAAMAAALAAATGGDFTRLDAIVGALGHPDDEIRLEAARLCERIGCSAAIGPLSRMAVTDQASDNRNQAICALLAIGRPAGVPALIAALGAADAARRDDARWALYRLLGKAVVPLLADEADDLDAKERERVEAFWRGNQTRFDAGRCYAFGLPASPERWIDELRADRSGVADAAWAALSDWTGEDFGHKPRAKVLARWQAWWDANRDRYEPGRRCFQGRPVP